MIPLVLFISLALVILILTELRERHRKNDNHATRDTTDNSCCGQHLVCERDKLLMPLDKPDYYDDEELDAYADIAPENLTTEQSDAIRDVFHSLREEDVTGWVRSMQMRHIALPPDIREEALLIVREQRLATGGH
ncbi:MAG: phospholipase [Paludibacteraceae bacterium]|nr:phospholipase [Paludibacteraceae bacterium]